jgi:hypothetical protein
VAESGARAAARLFHNSRREAGLVLLVWALALAWTVGYCYLRGYQHNPADPFDAWLLQTGLAVQPDPEEAATVAGLPSWVFVGVIVPWLACVGITMYFGMRVIADDDLGAEAEEGT